MAAIGGVIERFLLRRLEGQVLPQVLLTLGFAFIIADVCLMVWTGDPWQPSAPAELRGAVQAFGMFFPIYRLAILGVAVVIAIALWIMVDWTRLGAMIRAGVDDPPIARVVGIKVSQLFTLIFCLGAALAAFAGVMGAPYLSVYPGLDFEMLPLALIVVILGGSRQPARHAGRQLHHRLSLQLRPGQVPRSRLRHPVPADAAGPGAAAAGPVRPERRMTVKLRYAAIAVALALLATLPMWVGNSYYINIASQILLFAVFALALNVLVGYAGLVSLGHAGLFAIAGYSGGPDAAGRLRPSGRR